MRTATRLRVMQAIALLSAPACARIVVNESSDAAVAEVADTPAETPGDTLADTAADAPESETDADAGPTFDAAAFADASVEASCSDAMTLVPAVDGGSRCLILMGTTSRFYGCPPGTICVEASSTANACATAESIGFCFVKPCGAIGCGPGWTCSPGGGCQTGSPGGPLMPPDLSIV